MLAVIAAESVNSMDYGVPSTYSVHSTDYLCIGVRSRVPGPGDDLPYLYVCR